MTAEQKQKALSVTPAELTTAAFDPNAPIVARTGGDEGGIAGVCATCTDTEGEPDGGCAAGYNDTFNAGCNSTPPSNSTIALGGTVCGRSGNFIGPTGGSYRDTDWYVFNVPVAQNVTWNVLADFPVLIGFVGWPCPQTVFITSAVGTPCTVTSITTNLAPGDYVAFVAPSTFTGVPCGAQYIGSFAPIAAPVIGACCDTAGNCSVTVDTLCTGSGGTFQGSGTNCGDDSYVVATCTNALEDISGTGTLAGTASNCDDCSELNVPIGFNFDFYGNTYSSVAICSNGFLSFNQAAGCPFTNTAIPSVAQPNDMVAPFWDDFNPLVQGDVYYQTLAAPQRFVVQWNDVRRFGAASGSNTFQAILYATGDIEYRYGLMEGTLLTGTVGVENQSGTVATSIPDTDVENGFTCREFGFVAGTDPCADCPADVGGAGQPTTPDGTVDINDLLSVNGVYGQSGAPGFIPQDISGPTQGVPDGVIDINDLLFVVGNWGACP